MDLAARRSLVAAVRSLTERGSAVVVATHDTDLAAEMADRTIRLADGRAVQDQVEAEVQVAARSVAARPAAARSVASAPAALR
jgi:energy-coupling factor transport system ATP-binding protein